MVKRTKNYKEIRIPGFEEPVKYIDREKYIGDIPIIEREVFLPRDFKFPDYYTWGEEKELLNEIINTCSNGRLFSPATLKHCLYGDYVLSDYERMIEIASGMLVGNIPDEMNDTLYQKIMQEFKSIEKGEKEMLGEEIAESYFNNKRGFARRDLKEFYLNTAEYLKRPLMVFSTVAYVFEKERRPQHWISTTNGKSLWNSWRPVFIFGNQNSRFRKFVENRFKGKFKEAKNELEKRKRTRGCFYYSETSEKDAELNLLALYLGCQDTSEKIGGGVGLLTYDTNENYLSFRDAEMMIDWEVDLLNDGSRIGNSRIIFFK